MIIEEASLGSVSFIFCRSHTPSILNALHEDNNFIISLQIVLCVVLEATFASPIEARYGVPLAPLQTITIPEGPALLTAPRVIAEHQVYANGPFLAQPAQFLAQPAPVPVAAPLPIAAPLAFAAPAPVPALPVVGATSVQHHSQDEFGAFNYGYQDVNSAKQEIHTPDGVTRGSYSYVDANGLLQRVDYIADPINGFRVAGTNIPVGPGSVVGVGPAPVVDTPEVSAARAEFQRAFAEAEAAALVAPEDA